MNMTTNKTRTIGALLLVIPGVLFAQGTIDFRNRVVGVLDAPVYNRFTGLNVSGPDVVAQLYFSASPDQFSMVAVSDAPAPLRTGAGAGYWNPGPNATRVLDGIAPGETAFLQVRVWNAALFTTFEEAVSSGLNWSTSEIFSVTTGGTGSPPSLPAIMGGLTPIPYIPEPGTISLGLLGGMAMVFLGWRRKKR